MKRRYSPSSMQTIGGILACLVVTLAVAPSHADELALQTRAGISVAERLALIASLGGTEVGRIEALDVSLIEVEAGRARAAKSTAAESVLVQHLEPVFLARAADIPSDPLLNAQWGNWRIGSPDVWPSAQGENVMVAVVDTGIDRGHEDLPRVAEGYDFYNGDDDPADDNGHGTEMAGIVGASSNGLGGVGVAPASVILPVKVLNAAGVGPYTTIAQGIVYAADRGARIVNLSLAGDSASEVLQSAVDYATARGAVVIAAAGNAGVDRPNYPAACNSVVAVAATDQNDQVAGFSNCGAWIALTAPGVEIVTTNLRTKGLPYASVSGTSPATAFVSGAVATLLSSASNSPSAAVEALRHNATDLAWPGWDPTTGDGRLNLAAAYRALSGATNPTPAPTPATAPTPPPPPAPDRTKPQVNITYPTRNMTVAGEIPVHIAAADNVGIGRVELRVDGTYIGTDYDAPYEVTWNTSGFTDGLHALRAKAYDRAGNARSSKVIGVRLGDATTPVPPGGPDSAPPTIDRVRPTVAITNLGNGGTMPAVMIPIDVAAADNVGVSHVELRVDKVPVAVDTASPFGFVWDAGSVAPGRHAIAATAYDAAGNARLSRAVLVEIVR